MKSLNLFFEELGVKLIELKSEFDNLGYVWFRDAFSESDLNRLDHMNDLGAKAGARIKMQTFLKEAFFSGGSIAPLLDKILPNTKPVRVVHFNKSKETNWTVPWHQDRVIAVKEKHDFGGYKNWTKKVGIWHCEPPISVLAPMLFVRIHLDDTDEQNGAMEFAAGSHKEGFVSSEEAKDTAEKYNSHICNAKRGDVLVLKMLTLHRSLVSQSTSLRRTLRVDFASDCLPKPLSFF